MSKQEADEFLQLKPDGAFIIGINSCPCECDRLFISYKCVGKSWYIPIKDNATSYTVFLENQEDVTEVSLRRLVDNLSSRGAFAAPLTQKYHDAGVVDRKTKLSQAFKPSQAVMRMRN